MKVTQVKFGRDQAQLELLKERLHLTKTYGEDATALRMAVRMAHKYLDTMDLVLPNFQEDEWAFFASTISRGRILPPKPVSTGRPQKTQAKDGHKVIPLIPEKVLPNDL